MKRPILFYPLIFFHVFLSGSALAGGGMLLLKPDGSLLGMDPNWLSASPFQTYLQPGLILFSLGAFSLFTLVGLILKPSWRWASILNIYSSMHWAWTYSLYSGIILIVWITVQQILTQYFWLQPVMIFTGLIIIVFTMTPSVMRNFKNHEFKNQ